MAISTGPSLSPSSWYPGSWPHLAERGPLVLTLGTEVLTGVRVGEEHRDCAKFVEQPQADARGVPEPHGAVLVPVGRAVRRMPGSAPTLYILLCRKAA